MKIKYIMELEIPAIVSSIMNEVTDYYMVSYANQLMNCKYPDDVEKINLIIDKILSWYNENIEELAKKDMFFNSGNHLKNQAVLTELKKKIHEKDV